MRLQYKKPVVPLGETRHVVPLLLISALIWGCGDVSVEQEAPETQNETIQAKTGNIRGTITPPVDGTSINAFRGEGWVAFTTNDEEGNYEFRDLPVGTYALDVSAPFHFVDLSNRSIEVVAGEVTQAKPVFLRAWEDAAKLVGRVIDANTKQPLPEVKLFVICTSRICTGFSATSDAQGAFEIRLWPDLQAQLSIEHLGYQPQLIVIESLGHRNQKTIEIALVPQNQ